MWSSIVHNLHESSYLRNENDVPGDGGRRRVLRVPKEQGTVCEYSFASLGKVGKYSSDLANA